MWTSKCLVQEMDKHECIDLGMDDIVWDASTNVNDSSSESNYKDITRDKEEEEHSSESKENPQDGHK